MQWKKERGRNESVLVFLIPRRWELYLNLNALFMLVNIQEPYIRSGRVLSWDLQNLTYEIVKIILVLIKTFPWCAMFYIVFLTLKADCCLQAFAIVKAVLKLDGFMTVESSTASRQETNNISSLVPTYLAAVGAEEGSTLQLERLWES